ncbi:hypothetical protein [Puia sp.]|uniref:hypothetical protein n=1 Tax=Puia sp. TaxID=2045100 RepID=UPI002D80003B|nr:hypothetical protein [Puia sp.]
MRNAMVQLCLVIIGVSSIHAVKLLQTSSFHVRTFPAEGADRVWAVQGKDSVEMMNINGEYILRSINPGRWEISIEANEPYSNTRLNVSDVKPGSDVDLGEIRLQK